MTQGMLVGVKAQEQDKAGQTPLQKLKAPHKWIGNSVPLKMQWRERAYMQVSSSPYKVLCNKQKFSVPPATLVFLSFRWYHCLIALAMSVGLTNSASCFVVMHVTGSSPRILHFQCLLQFQKIFTAEFIHLELNTGLIHLLKANRPGHVHSTRTLLIL